MATIKKKNVGIDRQFGGFTPYGNETAYHSTLKTGTTGVVQGADSTSAPAVNDVIVLDELPEGYQPLDAQIIVSDAFGANVTCSLGFRYADGVDSAEVPQDAAYFGSGLALSATARLRATAAKAPVVLPKRAFLILTVTGAAIAEAGRADVVVTGVRQGPK